MPSFFGFKCLSMMSIFKRKRRQPSDKPRRSASIATTSRSSIYSQPHRPRPSTAMTIDPKTPDAYDHDIATKFGDNVMINDLELLLSMETQARMDALEEREEQLQRRTTTLKFELPPTPRTIMIDDTPSIPKRPNSAPVVDSSTPSTKGWRRKIWIPSTTTTTASPVKRSNSVATSTLSSRHGGELTNNSTTNSTASSLCSKEEAEDKTCISQTLDLGTRVRLLRRPLPTYGHVRFIGTVDFAPGEEWIGVELDSRVGKNDGSVKGKRYFQTDRDRGLFVLREDLAVVEA
ncbi:hypothetical protein O0I10_006793 [Lichtheimia ornata]|uniref:CAP-Gly domain-containing protein n=1 Tax=Lichtheimia ornata TaxID=688661 RepID=A0AAD7V4I0_9FUNG|nr:uncharacterized protein O0I10_006793 [Lichtheimia ornata]KAJ8657491.1 hypothetical protein O0I10_006793 [Lichtheimia ornata]